VTGPGLPKGPSLGAKGLPVELSRRMSLKCGLWTGTVRLDLPLFLVADIQTMRVCMAMSLLYCSIRRWTSAADGFSGDELGACCEWFDPGRDEGVPTKLDFVDDWRLWLRCS
jgi:cobalamin synthase